MNQVEEMWKGIKGYEGLYQVSNHGGVKSTHLSKGKELSQIISKDGYFKVYLSKNNKKKTFLVHRLVALHFIEKPQHQNEVNHIDADKINNKATNLEWCTRLENMEHAFELGLAGYGENCNLSKLTDFEALEIVKLRNEGMRSVEIAKIFNVSRDTVNRIVSGRSWSRVTGIKPKEGIK